MTHLVYQTDHQGSGSSKSYNNRGPGDLASQNRTSGKWFIKVLRSKNLSSLSHMQV